MSYMRCLLVFLVLAVPVAGAEPIVLEVWPGKPPGETKMFPPEGDRTKPEDKFIAGRPIIKLGNVSNPQIAVYRPSPEKSNGTAVVVCPGGGHNILAYDLEGTEVAEWLNSLGVTGIVLKYRVPFRDPEKRWIAAVQDAQRAMSLVRSKAGQWRIDPQRIGICGFSAGGETAALTSLFEQRQYVATDEIDRVPWRPDFAMLIYPGGLIEKGEPKLHDYVTVSKNAPPMFFVHAEDDRVSVQNSLSLASALKAFDIPTELHVFARGGHGYGLRETSLPVTRWPNLATQWLKDSGYLTSAKVAAWSDDSSLGNPADHLPKQIRQITQFGERADFSHDGRCILFLSKQFGEVMEYETATGTIRCLSQHFQHHGFNRAMYLSNGDILLTGPEKTFDRTNQQARTAARQQAMSWVLDKSGTKPPVPLGVQMVEGPAVSRTELKIAWTHNIEGKHHQTGISLGSLTYEGRRPRMEQVRLVLTDEDFPQGRRPKMIESQNFTPDGKQLTVTAYLLENGHNTDGYLFDFATHKLQNFTDTPDLYEEVEGIFPDGRSTLVERGQSSPKNPWAMVDSWRVWFDGSREPQRLTRFLDYPGFKATNYVVSDDRRWMAFQLGKSGDEAGVGYGLFLMDLTELSQ
jgi:acetyl esterase/lipase